MKYCLMTGAPYESIGSPQGSSQEGLVRPLVLTKILVGPPGSASNCFWDLSDEPQGADPVFFTGNKMN